MPLTVRPFAPASLAAERTSRATSASAPNPGHKLGLEGIVSKRLSERVLQFCVASKTEWERAGITGAMVTAMVIKGLIAREPTGGLYLTKDGRGAHS
jgi:hypothetical protein